jgi:hypothetical protein
MSTPTDMPTSAETPRSAKSALNAQVPHPSHSALQMAMLGLLLVVLAVPLLTMNLEPDAVSAIDNRALQPFPTLEASESFNDQITQFFADRIGLRAQMVKTYAVLNDQLFHVMTHPLYEYGKDGYVFFYYEEYHPDLEYLRIFADYLAETQRYCEERGSYFLYVITPEKSRVYPEYLPDTIEPQLNVIDYLTLLLDERNINYLDLAQPLIESKSDYEVFHKVYNAGHWSDTGAFIGIQAIIERIRTVFPQVAVPEFSDYTAAEAVYTELPVSNYPIYETGVTYELTDPSKRAQRTYDLDDEVARSNSYPSFRTYSNSSVSDAPSLLFFTGSYFNPQDHLSNNSFGRSVYVHNYYNAPNIAYYYNIFKPDIIVLDSADYTIHDVYFPRDMLADISAPPLYKTYEALPSVALSSSEAFTQIEPIERDAFGVRAETQNNIFSVEPDASGRVRLFYEQNMTVSNYAFVWNGPELSCAYLLANDNEYDVLLNGALMQVGLRTEDLREIRDVTVIGIDATGTRQYQVVIPVESTN